MSNLMYYMVLDDWYQEHVGGRIGEIHPLDPIARSVARKQDSLLRKMSDSQKTDAYRYSEGEPFRWW